MNWIGTNQNICILSFLTIFIQLYTQCCMEGQTFSIQTGGGGGGGEELGMYYI